ncbi:MAG TPA: hypothetical protein VJ850_08415 [Candidatus Limnocylindrales bacterium]|nr:hypothetical protein [Candidatus Limnocylindrales bacterium]
MSGGEWAPWPDQEFVEKMYAVYMQTIGDERPDAIELRGHLAVFLDYALHHDAANVTVYEARQNAAWLVNWMQMQGAKVRDILTELGGTLQDIDHKGKLDRFREGR